MKKLLLLTLCICISFLACVPVCAADTLAETTFETGDTEGWDQTYMGDLQIAVVTDTANTGKNCLKITGRVNSWDTPAYHLNTLLSQNGAGLYQVTAYLKLVSDGKSSPRMIIRQDKAGEGILPIAKQDITANDWVEFIGEVEIDDSILQSGKSIELCFDGDVGDFYLDDVSIVKKEDATAAVASKAWSYTMEADDFRSDGISSEFYLHGCTGHYNAEEDKAVIYIKNTSADEQRIDVAIGWECPADNAVITMVHTGYMQLAPDELVKFVLPELKKYKEKTNDDVGYAPDSVLSESSVVRIISQTLKEGDSFLLTGFTEIGSMNNQAFTDKVGNLIAADAPTELPQATKRAEISAAVGNSGTGAASENRLYEDKELKINPKLAEILSVVAVFSLICCAAGLLLQKRREIYDE